MIGSAIMEVARAGWRRVAGPNATLSQIPMATLRTVLGNHVQIQLDGRPFTIDLRDTIVSFDILARRRNGLLRGPMVYEVAESDLMRRLARPGDRIIDVGAHIGYYTILFGLAAGSEGKVLAIEPHPDNLEVLRKNVSDNKLGNIIKIAPVAVGAESGEATLFTSKYGNRGDNRLFASSDAAKTQIAVPVCTVDELTHDWDRVDLVKMDIQGYETFALAGMQKTLSSNPKVIVVTEFWPYGLRTAGRDPRSMLETLTGFGFELAQIRAKGPQKVDPEALLASLDGIRHADLICARPGVIAQRLEGEATASAVPLQVP